MRRSLAFLVALIVPLQVLAADAAGITRRDGFLLLWQSLGRPALETNKAKFDDVKEGDTGHREIIYAASRGIIDKEPDNFYPNESLTMTEALLWLYRSRNVDDPENITAETLSGYLLRYPIAHLETEEQKLAPVSQDQLLSLEQNLDRQLREEVHEVSMYGEKWHGQGTAFGESFDMNMLTAAHRTYPYNTLVRVTNVANGKSVVVRINDRGPYIDGRDMDLSVAAFTTIEDRSKGILNATFERLGDVSMVSACDESQARYQTRLSRMQRLLPGVPHTLALGETLSLRSNRGFVIRSILYPDGTRNDIQDWVTQEETWSLKPGISGLYIFTIGSLDGRKRTMSMNVTECGQKAE